MKTVLTKTKKLFLSKDGVGRMALDKKMLEMLEWKAGDQVELQCNLKTGEICIKRV